MGLTVTNAVINIPAAPPPTTSTFFFAGFGFLAMVGNDDVVHKVQLR